MKGLDQGRTMKQQMGTSNHFLHQPPKKASGPTVLSCLES